MHAGCMQSFQRWLHIHPDDKGWLWCIRNPHQIQSRLELNFDSSARRLYADCMQAACTPVKMKLITPAIDWYFLVFLTLWPTSACFFSSLIWPLFTPWVTGGLYFLLHQNQLHPKIDKINGHLPHTKKLHVIISKLQVTETQKWCRIFYEKEEVYSKLLLFPTSWVSSVSRDKWTFNAKPLSGGGGDGGPEWD